MSIAEDIARIAAAAERREDDDDLMDSTNFHELLDEDGAKRPEPPTPEVLPRTDGVGLFYRGGGKVNVVYGEPEAGKSWLTMGAAAAALEAEYEVLLVDLDGNGPSEVAGRLHLLGAPRWAVVHNGSLHHQQPTDATEVLLAIRQFIYLTRYLSPPTLAVVDNVGEMLSMFDADPNRADDYAAVMHAVTDPLVRAGACVLLVDHVSRGGDGRGPSGTVAKQRVVTGTSVEVRPTRQLVPGRGGESELWVTKDRPGGLRRRCPDPGRPRQLAGTFVMDPPGPDGVAPWRVESPLGPQQPGAADADAWSSAAAGLGQFTADQLAEAVARTARPTRAQQAAARRAIEKMAGGGHLRMVHKGGAGRGDSTLWEAS